MRIEFIDGLRAFISLGVFSTHYCLLFDPFIPGGFYSASVFVCEFFVISGFIVSRKFFQTQNSDSLTLFSLRRYVRLTAAPLASIFFSYVIIKFSLLNFSEVNPQLASQIFIVEPNFFNVFKEGLWGIYFSYNQMSSYNPVLWTMSWSLKGSILAAAFLALFGKIKHRWILYLVFFSISLDTLYPTFIFGVMLSDLLYSKEGQILHESLKTKNFLTIIIFCVGAFLSVYAVDFPSNVYKFLEFEFYPKHGIDINIFYHMIAAGLIMYSVLNLKPLQKILSWKPLTKIGEYSFSLYLLHVPILLSVGSSVFMIFSNRGSSVETCILFGSLAAILATIPAVFLLHRCVDTPTAKLAKRVQKFFE